MKKRSNMNNNKLISEDDFEVRQAIKNVAEKIKFTPADKKRIYDRIIKTENIKHNS